MKHALLFVLAVLAVSGGPAAVRAAPAQTTPIAAAGRSADNPVAAVCTQLGAAVRRLQPGSHEVIPVSLYHLNRLITPFLQVRATSSNETASLQTRGAVVYVQPADEAPLSLYLTDQSDESQALSVTLIPCKVPPREITLLLPTPEGRPLATTAGSAPAPVADLVALLRAVALEQTPAGYALRRWQRGDPQPGCGGGLTVHSAQVLEGTQWRLVVSRLDNPGTFPVTLVEAACDGPGVAAVAVWPSPPLSPGGSAELYVVYRQPAAGEAPRAARPSLLNGRRP